MSTGGLHTAWARLFARALVSAGIDGVVISPGSRSTPLALAFEHEAPDHVSVVIDERSAGFVALGRARWTGRPCALLCTSGSAGAHYLPAVVEAERCGIPLVIVTADRPWELTHAGASQTMDQTHLFGRHVRGAFELGEPTADALPHVVRLATQAVHATLWPIGGPVHVNARFRKPLEPVHTPDRPEWEESIEHLRSHLPQVFRSSIVPDSTQVGSLLTLVRSARRPLLVAGPWMPLAGASRSESQVAWRRSVARWCHVTGMPLLAEQVSGLPGAAALELVCRGEGARLLDPDLVIEVGSPPVAGTYESFSKKIPTRAVVSPLGYPDPTGRATHLFAGDATTLLSAAAEAWSKASIPSPSIDPDWCRRVEAFVSEASRSSTEAATGGEPAALRTLADALPPSTVLCMGNSLTVRDSDVFGRLDPGVTVLHQRGLAGIDGLIAGAVGTRQAVSADRPVVLVLGDVSAAHDLGSLMLLRRVSAPLVVVVVDNAGGRIFTELPVAQVPELAGSLDRLFLTAPGEVAGPVAAALGIASTTVGTIVEFASAMRQALDAPHASVIVVRADPEAGAAIRRSARTRVDALARRMLADV